MMNKRNSGSTCNAHCSKKKTPRSGGGMKLNLRRFSIRTLRTRFRRFFFSLLKLHLIPRPTLRSSSSSSSKPNKLSVAFSSITAAVGLSRTTAASTQRPSLPAPCNSRLKSLARTSSFYKEAIADCLDFIKRSSTSSSCSAAAGVTVVDYRRQVSEKKIPVVNS